MTRSRYTMFFKFSSVLSGFKIYTKWGINREKGSGDKDDKNQEVGTLCGRTSKWGQEGAREEELQRGRERQLIAGPMSPCIVCLSSSPWFTAVLHNARQKALLLYNNHTLHEMSLSVCIVALHSDHCSSRPQCESRARRTVTIGL